MTGRQVGMDAATSGSWTYCRPPKTGKENDYLADKLISRAAGPTNDRLFRGPAEQSTRSSLVRYFALRQFSMELFRFVQEI